MDHDLPNRSWSRNDLARDNQLGRDLDEATPGAGSSGVIIGAVVLLVLGVVYAGPPVGKSVPSRDAIEAPVSTTAARNP